MSGNDLVVFQADSGGIELLADASEETIWASQRQIAELFGVDVRTVNEHLVNVFKTAELAENRTIRKFRIVQKEGSRSVEREVLHYNLDAIISVGYRVNSKSATRFRQWATQTLRSYIVDGFAINRAQVEQNSTQFFKAIEDLKQVASGTSSLGSSEVVDIAKQFAHTWLSLDAYDKSQLPTGGVVAESVHLAAEQLQEALAEFRQELIAKGEATELFGQEKESGSFVGLFGNVFQSFGGADVYPTVEEKAAHLLYFVVKNHVFNDGNKRSGAYSFVWMLRETGLLSQVDINPQALLALTLLVAESDPSDKDRLIGLILLMLGAPLHREGN